MSDFDNVYIIPKYSDVERNQIDLSTNLFSTNLKLPILSSPMDTVTGLDMMAAIKFNGGYGIHHRYCSYDDLLSGSYYGGIAVSPSMELSELEKILKLSPNNIAVLDVAHGHTKRNLEFCKNLIMMGWNVVSGNICTKEAAEAYLKIGVHHLRVGIGSGSVCTTRKVTGVGIPQYLAIPEIKEEFNDQVYIIADGGLATTGDICKAFALGADFVMLGRMLAATKESICGMRADDNYGTTAPYGEYSGMASANALIRNGKTEFFVEGITNTIKIKTTVSKVMKEIKDALETACYYTGSRNPKEMYGKYKIIK